MYHVLKLIKYTAVSYAVIESESKIQKQLKRYFSIIACIVGTGFGMTCSCIF